MKYLIAFLAGLLAGGALAAPSKVWPYPINPGVGAIYKGPSSEIIIEGPDGSVITSEQEGGAVEIKDEVSPVATLVAHEGLGNRGYIAAGGHDGGYIAAGGHNGGYIAAEGLGAYAGVNDLVANHGVGAGHGLLGAGFVDGGHGAVLSGANGAVVATGGHGPAIIATGPSSPAVISTVEHGPAVIATGRHVGPGIIATGGHGGIVATGGHGGGSIITSGGHGGIIATGGHGGAGIITTGGHGGIIATGGHGEAGIITSGDHGGLIATGGHGGAGIITTGGHGGIIATGGYGGPAVIATGGPAIGGHNGGLLTGEILANHGVISAGAPGLDGGVITSVTHEVSGPSLVAAPVVALHENPIVVEDLAVVKDPKIVEEHVLVGDKIISVPKKLEENTDLIGPSGTISTRGGDAVVSGPSSITIKGGGVVSSIEKQDDIHVKTIEVKPVIAPIVVKPIAPVLDVVAQPVYAAAAPNLGLHPVLSHRPSIIRTGPIVRPDLELHPNFLPTYGHGHGLQPDYRPLYQGSIHH